MAQPITYTADDLDKATRTVAGEARGEPVEGQQGVAWVIRTRAAWSPPAWWGASVADACTKRWQFSCWNGGQDTDYITNLAPTDPVYLAIQAVVKAVLDGKVEDPTNGATTYKVTGTKASWDAAVAEMTPVVIGRHSFFVLPPNA